ncbi:hypothetical protein ACOMHN_006620 [Nucella lapillus]
MPLQRTQYSPQHLSHDVTSFPVQANQSEDKDKLLQDINDHKAMMLLPAILLITIFLLMGLLSNPLAIYIYGWRWQSSSTKIFLFALAVIDLLNCMITIPTEIISMRNYYDFPSDALCKVSRFITYVLNNATVVIFLSIAIDRYIRICHPHKNAVSARRAKIACGIGLLVGLTVSWPALVLYERIEMQIPAKLNPPVFVTGAMCLVHNAMELYSLAFFIYLCSAFFICVLILVILYTLIGRTILKRKRMSRQRKEATQAVLKSMGGGGVAAAAAAAAAAAVKNGNAPQGSNFLEVPSAPSTPRLQRQETAEELQGCGNVQNLAFRCKKLRPPRATLMLFLITVVFITSFLPFLIISIFRQDGGTAFYLGLNSKEQIVVNIFIRSYIVNNCTNPIVYGLCNSQFREECKRLYSSLFHKGRFMPSSSTTNLNRSKTAFETPKLERKASPEP